VNDPPEFDATCSLVRELGFVVEDARATPEAFGSWFITARVGRKLFRVAWDGRDEALVIQEPSLSGIPQDWGDRWIAGRGYRHKPGELREGLLSMLEA